MSSEGVHSRDVSPLLFQKPNKGARPSTIASTSQAVAEAVAESEKKEGVPVSLGSGSSLFKEGKPSPQSKLDWLLQLHYPLKAGAAVGSMAKKQPQQHAKAAQEDGNTTEGPSPSNAPAATKGDAFSPRRLFDAPGPPSHPLFRKEGQSITSAIGRRSLRQSRSQSHRSPRVSGSGGGGVGGGGSSLMSQSSGGFVSCPSSPGPEGGRLPKTGGEGSTKGQSHPLSGRASSNVGGGADAPNCSTLSIEPWLAAGVVEHGGRSFSRARGSGKHRSSGVGLGSPLGGGHTPGRSPSMKRRSESRHKGSGNGTHEREGSLTGEEDKQASSFGGRGSGSEGRESQRQSQGHSARSSSDFFAILKKQHPQRAVQGRKSMDRPHSPSPPPPSTPSAMGAPNPRKPPSLILQQQHQQHGQHPRSPDLSSAGPASTQSLRTPSARPSLELRSHRSDGGASTASRESSVKLPVKEDSGANIGGPNSSAAASQGPGSERSTRSPVALPGISHPSPFSNYPPSTSGGPTLTTIFSGALSGAAKEAREVGEFGEHEDSGQVDLPSRTNLESSPSSSNPQPPTPHGTPAFAPGKDLGSNPLFSNGIEQTEPRALSLSELERDLSAPESIRQGHGLPSSQQQQQQQLPQQLSSPSTNVSSLRPRTPGSRSPPPGSQTARERRREKAATILMARRASQSPPATSNGRPRSLAAAAHGREDTGIAGLDYDNVSNSNADQESVGTEVDPRRQEESKAEDADQSQEGQDGTPAYNPLYGLPAFHRSASIKYNTLRRLDTKPRGRPAALVPWNSNFQPDSGAAARRMSNLSSKSQGGLYTVGSCSAAEVGSNASDHFAGAAPSTGTAMRTARSKSPPRDARPVGRPPPAPNGYAARLAHRNALQELENARKKKQGPKRYAASTAAWAGKKAPASQPSLRGRPVLKTPTSLRTSNAPSSRRSSGSSSQGGLTFLDHGGNTSNLNLSSMNTIGIPSSSINIFSTNSFSGSNNGSNPRIAEYKLQQLRNPSFSEIGAWGQQAFMLQQCGLLRRGSVTEGEREQEERVGDSVRGRALLGSHDVLGVDGVRRPVSANAIQRSLHLEQLYPGPGLYERPPGCIRSSKLRPRVSFSECLSQPEKTSSPRGPHTMGSRKMSALVHEILQEQTLDAAASGITPEVLAQLGLTPLETQTTHQATTSALAALRSGSFDRRSAAENGMEGSIKQGALPASTGQLPIFLRTASDKHARPIYRSHDSLQGWLRDPTRSGAPDMFQPISLPTRPKTAGQTPTCTTPPKSARDSEAQEAMFATPPRRLMHSSTQPRSASNHGGPIENNQIQRSCSGRSSIGSHSLPPLALPPNAKGPDAPGSYTSRLRAAKAMQGSVQYRTTTSPRGSSQPSHRRVLSMPAGAEGLHDSDLDPAETGMPLSPGQSARKFGKSWAGEDGTHPGASMFSTSSKRSSVAGTPQDGQGPATPEDTPPGPAPGSPLAASSTSKFADKAQVFPSPTSPQGAASPDAGGGVVREEEMLSVPEREEEGVDAYMGKKSKSSEGGEEAEAEDDTLPKIAMTLEGHELLQQVVQDGYTVGAALADLKSGVPGRVKGGLLQQWEEAQRAKQEKEADKAAGCCSCFGPPKPAKKPQRGKAQQQQPQQQRLEFLADEEKVTFVERGGPGVPEKLHNVKGFKHDMPWSRDALVTLDCGAQDKPSQVRFTTASGADFACVVLGLQAALQQRREVHGGRAAGLDCLVGDLPWIAY